MCMGGGLSIVLGLRELRLEGAAADERLVGHAADDGLAPVLQGIPDGDWRRRRPGRRRPRAIAPDVVQEPVAAPGGSGSPTRT